jgi:deoxycytidylate deaminase
MTNKKKYFKEAAKVAENATCTHAKCGSIIVSKDGEIIGTGFNAPPLNLESQQFCDTEFDSNIKPKYDKTCCVHAEWNAIIDALKNKPDKIENSTLYFMRVDLDGEFTNAGSPFCTVCSRLALQSGIGYFALWDKKPIIYDCAKYNKKSYDYYK